MPHGLDGIAEGRGLSSPFFLYSLVAHGSWCQTQRPQELSVRVSMAVQLARAYDVDLGMEFFSPRAARGLRLVVSTQYTAACSTSLGCKISRFRTPIGAWRRR